MRGLWVGGVGEGDAEGFLMGGMEGLGGGGNED